MRAARNPTVVRDAGKPTSAKEAREEAGLVEESVFVVTTRAQGRLWQAHRSTFAGLTGIGLMALGVVAQLAKLFGNVVPVVLGVAGFLMLNAGIAIGVLLVVNNARWRRDQSYYDPDDEEDE